MADKKTQKQRDVARFLRERDRARLRAQSRRLAALLVLRERAESERAGALAIQARRYSGKKSRVRATERRQESDQEVERDIPPELVSLWRKTKRHLKPTARMSRAEQFMKWAEDNPGEVLDAQADAAARDVERLVREHAAQDRKMRDRKRYRRSAEEITAELAKAEEDEEVPF